MESRLMLSSLNNLLLHDQKDIMVALKKFDKLDEYNKKIVLLSAMFHLGLSVEIRNIGEFVTSDQLIHLMYIKFSKKIKGNFEIEFCTTGVKAYLRYVEKNSSCPIDKNIIFKDIDSMDLNNMSYLIYNACEEWAQSDDFLYAPEGRMNLYELTKSVTFNEGKNNRFKR